MHSTPEGDSKPANSIIGSDESGAGIMESMTGPVPAAAGPENPRPAISITGAAGRQTLVVDNLRAAVLQADWYAPDLNPRLQAIAEQYGTVILPDRPRTPRHTGKIENQIGYGEAANRLSRSALHSLGGVWLFLRIGCRHAFPSRRERAPLHATIKAGPCLTTQAGDG